MIEAIDVRTLAFVSSLVFLSVAAILTLVFFTRRVYAGFGYWLLWQFCLTAGVLVFWIRDPEPSPTVIVATQALLLLAPALLFDGLARFNNLYTSRLPALANYALVAVALAAQWYFSFVSPDLDARIVVYSMTRTVILVRCALEPLNVPEARRSPSFWALAVIMLLVSVNDLHHGWAALQEGPIADPQDNDSVRRALIAAVVGDVLAAYALMLLTSERLEAELHAARHDIEMLARTDSLTGLWNRRHFEDVAEAEFARARRYGTPLALLALDADHFKRVNDQLGHHAGDLVLREIADLVGQRIRRSDILCRWGGEEFMVLAPGTEQHDAAAMAEKIRLAVAGHGFATVGTMTVSVGVGRLEDGETAEAWMRRVDAALYEAKLRGRNRVVVAATDPATP